MKQQSQFVKYAVNNFCIALYIYPNTILQSVLDIQVIEFLLIPILVCAWTGLFNSKGIRISIWKGPVCDAAFMHGTLCELKLYSWTTPLVYVYKCRNTVN